MCESESQTEPKVTVLMFYIIHVDIFLLINFNTLVNSSEIIVKISNFINKINHKNIPSKFGLP